MCRSGLRISTPAGGGMSPAVTSAGPLAFRYDGGGLVELGADHELLQVQDDVGDVLGHLRDRRELVQHAVDPDRRDGRAGDRRQQRAPQRVAERVAESRLQRLDGELRAGRREDLFRDLGPGDDEHGASSFGGGSSISTPLSLLSPATAPGVEPPRTRGATARVATLLDAAALARPAAVVRHRRHVLDAGDLEAGGGQRADRGLAAGARALHEHVDLLQPVLLRGARGLLGGELRGERRGLARALEARRCRRSPSESVLPWRSVIVTIVLLNVDLMWAWPWATFFFSRRFVFFALGFAMWSASSLLLRLPSSCRRRPSSGPCGCGRSCACAGRGPGGCGGGGRPGSSRSRSCA